MSRGLAGLLAGNLFPVALLLAGVLDPWMLIACYWLEWTIATARWASPSRDVRELGVLLLNALFAFHALSRVDWSWTAALVILSSSLLPLALDVAEARLTGGALPPVTGGQVAWLAVVVLVGALVGGSLADDARTLGELGVEPGSVPVPTRAAVGLGWLRLTDWLGVDAPGVAALMMIVFKTVNEALWAVRRAPEADERPPAVLGQAS